MTTILRVKRRLEDNPQEALVITCKKFKTDVDDVSPSLFVFRGTVENQETKHLKSIVPRCDVKQQATVNVKDIVDKLRKEHTEVSAKNRYEVVNYSRGLKDENEGKDDLFNLVDLQKSEDTDVEVQYAYDLYTAAKKDSDISDLDTFINIETDLIFYPHINGRGTPSSDEIDDDDDSNDENNWRNDYPDSEVSSVDMEDMITAMKSVDIDNLSSDEGEDKIYDNDYEENVKLYGAPYAKYKAKILSKNPDMAQKGLIQYCKQKNDFHKKFNEDREGDSDDGFYYCPDEDGCHWSSEQQNSSHSSDAYSID